MTKSRNVGRGWRGNGVGKGDGWGGPAKGASTHGKVPRFQPGNPGPRKLTKLTPEQCAIRRQERNDRVESLIDALEVIAYEAEREETQLSAAIAFLNRLDGLPVARNLNHDGRDGTLAGLIADGLKTPDPRR